MTLVKTMGMRFGSLGLIAMAVAACGSASSDGEKASDTQSALSFHAEAAPLADFAYDTGLVPAGSPAQVQLKLSAGGGLKIDAAVVRDDDGLVGKRRGGKLAIDLHVKMDGRLEVDSTFKSYDGDLPGLKDIDIPIVASVPFDGLLLADTESARATAELPETTLPEIPLGGVPGSLVITIAKGSQVTSTFHGGCLAVSGGKATYAGEATTSGKLVLSAKLVVKLPTPLDKSVDLPPITIAIPEVTTKATGAAIEVAGAPDSSHGACGAAPAARAGGNGAPATSAPPQRAGSPDGGASEDPSPSGLGSSTFSVTVDGKKGTPVRVASSVDVVDGVVRHAAYLYFTAPGLAADTRVIVYAEKAGAGCLASDRGSYTQIVSYQPDDGTFHTFDASPSVGPCGLVVTTLDHGRLTGAFSGTLKEGTYGSSAEANVAVAFDVALAP